MSSDRLLIASNHRLFEEAVSRTLPGPLPRDDFIENLLVIPTFAGDGDHAAASQSVSDILSVASDYYWGSKSSS